MRADDGRTGESDRQLLGSAGDAPHGIRELPPARRPLIDEILGLAVLAASGHNTQPWTFSARGSTVTIRPDFTRRTPVVDPDDHHLFVSLGCATENLVLAAVAHGLFPDVAAVSDRIEIALQPCRARPSILADAIPHRQSSRSVYDGRALAPADLEACAQAGRHDGVDIVLLTERPQIATVAEYVVRGNRAQMADAAFVGELRDWVRFNAGHAARTGDGLFSGATGHPSVPAWIGRPLFRALLRPAAEERAIATQVQSASGVVVFVAAADDPAHWIAVGRAFERFALQATALNIRTACVNQPVEVPELRAEFARWLGVGARRPDLVVRFGGGPSMPRSWRRPLKDVLTP